MNYAINFSCSNKEEASGEVWPENRWNATIKAINTVFHLEVLLRIRNNSCSDGFVWQRCCNERVCRTYKKLKKRKERIIGLETGCALEAGSSLPLFPSSYSSLWLVNITFIITRLWAHIQFTRQLFSWWKIFLFFKALSFNVILNSC